MLVFDFQNIGKIKNLKNSQYVEPKHGAAIQDIPNTILGGFKYTQYKMIPPHRNESMKTMTELIKLSNVPSNDEFTLKMDKVKESFKELCEDLGLDFPKKKVKELKEAAGSIILDLKYHFNRPRPYKLAPLYNIELDTNEIEDTTSDSPSYPSGHATQGILIGNYLSHIYPLHRGKFLNMGRDIARSRIIAKVHYPSDVQMGQMIGNDMFRYLKENKLI
jgi:acid phosphatase (class A)